MKRQVTHDITTFFPIISKKQAILQSKKDLLELEMKVQEIDEHPIAETIVSGEEENNEGRILVVLIPLKVINPLILVITLDHVADYQLLVLKMKANQI